VPDIVAKHHVLLDESPPGYASEAPLVFCWKSISELQAF
jgi:hypothetical protein